MEQTSIQLGQLIIMEPVTTLTDLIVALVCFVAFYNLKHHPDSGHLSKRLYRYFFLAMALSTLYGGLIGHAFLHYLSFGWKAPGWIVSMLSVALAERAAIMHARPVMNHNYSRFFAVLNIIELLTFMTLTLTFMKFIYVEIHALYGLMLVVFAFEFYVFKKVKDQGSKLVLLSVGIGFLTLIVHLAKISIHPWFNFLDLSHVLMAISSYIMYKGVDTMKIYVKTDKSQ